MRFALALLRTAYYLLYHQLAWTYDLAAAIVSLGKWRSWTRCSLPFLNGRVLEIGYGPGHLQLDLHDKGFTAYGVDESRQMAHQALRRLWKKGILSRLSRGYAQNLPFHAESFDSIVSTFPSEYIFDPQTLKEAQRVLRPGGSLVIIPMAWITGNLPWEKSLAWLMRIVGEAPGKPGQLPAAVRERFKHAGLLVNSTLVDIPGSKVLVVTGLKV